jgi:hypothetical protein
MNEIHDALQKLQILTLEALLVLCDLEEANLTREIESPVAPAGRREAAINRRYEVPIEREIILGRLADLDPPLGVLRD